MTIGIVMAVIIALIWFVIAWAQHASPLIVLYMTASGVLAGVIGTMAGWAILRRLYPQYRGGGKRPSDTSSQADLKEEIELEYELNLGDVMAFYLHHYEQSPRLGRTRKLLRRMLLFSLAMEFVTVIILVAAFAMRYVSVILILGVLAAATFLYYLFSPSLMRMAINKAVTKRYDEGENTLIGRHRISITSDAVADVTDSGELTAHWSAAEYVASTDQYLFMVVREARPYIIPRRAFGDEASFRRVVEAATAYHRAAMAQNALI